MKQEIFEALGDLSRAYQAALLYPDGHPAVRSTVAASWGGLSAVLEQEDGLALRVGKHQLALVGDEDPVDGGPVLRNLISTLHELDVSSLELRSGLSEDELVQFVDALIQARRADAMGRERLRVLTEDGLPHVRLSFIDYTAFSFREGVKEKDEAKEQKDVWLELIDVISADDTDTDAQPESYAREVTNVIEMREGAGIGRLREVIHRAHEESQSVGSKQMEATRVKILRFLGALSPDLRSDLLRIDPRRPNRMLGLVTDLADDLQLSDLLKSLDALDTVGGDIPSNLIPLLAKLVQMSDEGDDRGLVLRNRMRDWGLSSVPADLGEDELREALAEVLQRRGDLTPNPEFYGRMLEGLVRGRLEGIGRVPYAELYGDPGEPSGLRLQSLEIAMRLLREELTDLSAGPLARLSLESGLLLRQGRLETLREAAAAAVEVSRRKDASEPLQLASRGFLETFGKRKTIDGILSHSAKVGGMSGSALYLMGLGGREATQAVIESLEVDSDSPLAEDLLEFLGSGGTIDLVGVVRKRLGEDEKRLQPTVQWLRRLKAEKALAVLEVIYDHPSSAVRRRALVELCRRTTEPDLVKGYLSRGLQDQDRLVAEQAFRLLLTLDSRQVNDLLEEILRSVIEGRERSTYWATPLASRLVRGGSSQGLERLVSLLGDLRWSWRARHGRLALALSKVLEPFAGKPDVADVLRQIRYSPAGAMALVQASVAWRRKGESG